jgi:hypothetical protein
MPLVVLAVTPDAATARWAAEPVDLGWDTSWRALVVGPEGIPVITDLSVGKPFTERAFGARSERTSRCHWNGGRTWRGGRGDGPGRLQDGLRRETSDSLAGFAAPNRL